MHDDVSGAGASDLWVIGRGRRHECSFSAVLDMLRGCGYRVEAAAGVTPEAYAYAGGEIRKAARDGGRCIVLLPRVDGVCADTGDAGGGPASGGDAGGGVGGAEAPAGGVPGERAGGGDPVAGGDHGPGDAAAAGDTLAGRYPFIPKHEWDALPAGYREAIRRGWDKRNSDLLRRVALENPELIRAIVQHEIAGRYAGNPGGVQAPVQPAHGTGRSAAGGFAEIPDAPC